MGRPNSRNGPSLAFSLPLSDDLELAVPPGEGGAHATRCAEPLSRWLPGWPHLSTLDGTAGDATNSTPGDAGGGNSSSKGGSDGDGEHVLGVAGNEGGEEAMLCGAETVTSHRGVET